MQHASIPVPVCPVFSDGSPAERISYYQALSCYNEAVGLVFGPRGVGSRCQEDGGRLDDRVTPVVGQFHEECAFQYKPRFVRYIAGSVGDVRGVGETHGAETRGHSCCEDTVVGSGSGDGTACDVNAAAERTVGDDVLRGCRAIRGSLDDQVGKGQVVADGDEDSHRGLVGGAGEVAGESVVETVSSVSRGKNWSKNRRSRLRKEHKKQTKETQKKETKQVDESCSPRVCGVGASGKDASSPGVPLWRSKRVDGKKVEGVGSDFDHVGGFQRRGYFAECSGDVQTRLRESRAKMLIAENEKKEAEAIERKRKMDSVTPEIALVTELIRVTRMANQLKKQTKDQRVGGWAETVADTLTRSTAESAPSSMPSLKSVEEGSSALKSDGVEAVFDEAREVRLAQYNVAKLRLDRCYEQEDCIDLVDQKKRYEALKMEFSDVAMSEVDRENALTASRIAESMQDCGVDQYTIQAALEGAGFSYDLGFI